MHKIFRQFLFLSLFLLGSCASWFKPVQPLYQAFVTYFNAYYDANKLYENHMDLHAQMQTTEISILEPPQLYYAIDPKKLPLDSLLKAEMIITGMIQQKLLDPDHRKTNPMLDDSYLLLANIRLAQGKYSEALESYFYTYDRYKLDDETYYLAKLGEAKAYLMLGNLSYALDIVDEILRFNFDSSLDYIREDAVKIKLQAELEILGPAELIERIDFISKYKLYLKNSDQRDLLYYFAAYHARTIGRDDVAKRYFKRIVEEDDDEKISLYSRVFYASYQEEVDFEDLEDDLNEIIVLNGEDETFKWDVYYFFAQGAKSRGADTLAHHYSDLVISNSQNDFIRGLAFKVKAEIALSGYEFLESSLAYDSATALIPTNKMEYAQVVKNKQDVDIIGKYIKKKIQLEDNLDMIYYTDEELDSLVLIKQQDTLTTEEKLTQNAPNILRIKVDRSVYGNNMDMPFYFYNTSAVRMGLMNFISQHGQNAPYEKWKWNKPIPTTNQKPEDTASIENYKNVLLARQKQLADSEDSIIDALIKLNFDIASIYRNNFKLYQEAIDLWEETIDDIDSRHVLYLPALYALYVTYDMTEQQGSALKYKKAVVNQFPNSIFAQKILGKKKRKSGGSRITFRRLYFAYKNKDYKKVIRNVDDFISDAPYFLKPKAMFMKAVSRYKLDKTYPIYKELEFIYYNYPTNPIAKRVGTTMTMVRSF